MKTSAVDILELLMQGIHPITGEIFDEDHVCNEPLIIRALACAAIALRQADENSIEHVQKDKAFTNRNGRLNAGRPWNDKDDAQLRDLFLNNTPIENICKLLHRRNRGVMNRLAFLKLIEKTDAVRRPGLENAGALWSDADDQKLRDMFNLKLPIKDISGRFKRTPGAIRSRLVKLGLIENKSQYVDGLRPWTQKDTDLLRLLYADGISIPLIAARFDSTESAIRARLFYLGLLSEAPNVLPERNQ